MEVYLMVSLFVVALLLLQLLLLLWLWPLRRVWTMAGRLPGPPAWPLFGNLNYLRGDANHTFNALVNVFKEYGHVVRVWLGPKLLVFLSDPEDAQALLGNLNIRNRDLMMTKILLPFIGTGLITARNERWRKHRKLITPNFHFKILNSYVEIFGRMAQSLCAELEKVADGSTVDIHKYVSVYTANAICATAIGCNRHNNVSEDVLKFSQAISRGTNLLHNRLVKPWLLVDWLYALSSEGREIALLGKEVYSFVDKIIQRKLLDFRGNAKVLEVNADSDDKRKNIKSILDLLIESSEEDGQSGLSPKEMRDELTTIAIAGFETGLLTISTICLLLGMHPKVQDEISRELDEIFGKDTRDATAEDITQMHCLGRVIKEALRLFPVAPLFNRELSEDLTLPSGHVLPAGSSAIVFAYMLHRDERYFPEPELFLPDRWLDDGGVGAARHPFAYVPFGAGPRNCIGQKYAMLQMKSVLSAMLRRFRVATKYTMEDMKHLEVSVSLKLSKKYEVQLTRK